MKYITISGGNFPLIVMAPSKAFTVLARKGKERIVSRWLTVREVREMERDNNAADYYDD